MIIFIGGIQEIGSAFTETGEIVSYLLVLLFAAIPWIEIAVVIPLAIGFGLNPVLVGSLAFIGNSASVLLLIRFAHLLPKWRSRQPDLERGDQKRRTKWGWSVWDRYGLPGLSLAAPVVTGVHLAALMAIVVDSKPIDIARWMTISIFGWSLVLVVLSVSGMTLLGLG